MSNWDTKTDTLRIDGVDLSTSAQTVSVRAVDAAGNAGTVASQVVDSSYHYEVSLLAASQPLDAYVLAFGDGAFATDGASGHGYVAGGMVSMLGGVDHNLTVGVVSLPDSSVQEIDGDITVNDSVTASSAYFTNEVSARIQTGGGMDAIIDNGNADITLVYDTLASTGPDVMIGFDSGSDAIELNGNAAIAVDTNRNGVLSWATAPQADVKFAVGAGTEAVEISTTGAIVIGNTAADAAQTAQTLNAALDVSGLSADAGVLVLANDADHSVLFYVNDTKHDGIDAADVTVIAVMGQGEVHQGDIHIVGSSLVLP